MPFLPFVLLLAWQALSRGASFALGWATALYFGQVPGRQGRMLAVVSLIAAAWVILIVGFAVPIFLGAGLEAGGLIDENFDVETIHYVGLVAGIVLIPPAAAAITVWGEIHEERSIGRWLRLIPVSYPATFMLGAGVLMMCAFTPVALFRRWRHGIKYVQVSLMMREGTDDDDLVEAVRDALGSIGITDIAVADATGPKTWPLRTVGFAVKHMLGATVRGDPIHVEADGIELYAYATTISIQGPKEETYRVRAALERKLGFHDAYLTWNDDAHELEDALLEAHRGAHRDVDALRARLDEIQERMDTASLNDEEWNVLYRRRLQIELHARAEQQGADDRAEENRRAEPRRERTSARSA
jgi:hypothetical protein